MKRGIMWLLCWGTFWCGDIVSKIGYCLDKTPLSFLAYVWYPVYNWFMCISSDINDRYNFDVWTANAD